MNSPYYTQPQTNKNTEILETIDTITNCLITAHRGIVKVTEQVVGYEKRKVFTGERISVHPLELPPMTFVGQGIWLEIPRPMLDELILHDLHPMGSIHATEHAVLSLMPLFALCDRNDVGGISFELNSQVGAGAIFFYDGYPGGAGLAWRAFDVLKPLLEKTLSLIRDCPCELGCPSCIHSPKCGSGNHPLDKQGSIQLLEWLLGNTFQPSENHEKPERVIEPAIETQSPHTENIVENSTTEPSQSPFPNDFQILTFDLETQLSAEEVGGWEMARHMRLAVGVIHDSTDDKFHIYDEKSADELIEHLHRANLVVGFNLIRFDYQVLRGYTMDNLQSLPTLDILKEISNSLGYRLTLDSLATTTLGVTKIADGLQSLEWVRQGRMDLVTDYCQKDVEITRDLFLYGVKNGYLLYNRKGMGDVRVQVNWSWDRLRAISQSP
jgi:DEAD/DEAH box helicase domain-containing protein